LADHPGARNGKILPAIEMAIRDPFARKMVLGGLAFAFVLLVMISVFTMIYFHVHPTCSDEIVSESISPTRQFTATIMQRRCGEEAPFVTHINLRSTDHSIQYGFFSGKAEQGEIFSIEQDAQSSRLALTWSSSSQLTIRCHHCKNPGTRHERWENVMVRYESSE